MLSESPPRESGNRPIENMSKLQETEIQILELLTSITGTIRHGRDPLSAQLARRYERRFNKRILALKAKAKSNGKR